MGSGPVIDRLPTPHLKVLHFADLSQLLCQAFRVQSDQGKPNAAYRQTDLAMICDW